MRKNIFSVIVLVCCVAFIFTGCTVATVEEREITVTVISCTQGEFHPDANYQAMAIVALKKNSMTLYNYYTKLAQDNGTYDYVVSFQIDDSTHSVIRSIASNAGDKISVTQIITHNGDTILSTEYR